MPTLYEATAIMGSGQNDALYVNKAAVDAINNMPHDQYGGFAWSGEAYAEGGNDTIVRDRTGGYYGPANGNPYHDAHLYGGAGNDIVSYAGLSTGVNINLDFGIAVQKMPANAPDHMKPFGLDRLFDIEGAVGTAHNDGMLGGADGERLWGHDGNDTLLAAGGGDSVYGGTGNDYLEGGAGADMLSGENGHDTMRGGSGNDTAYGGDGNDKLYGGGDYDRLNGGKGADSIFGGADGDIIEGGEGADVLHGGFGNDSFKLGDGADAAWGDWGNDTFSLSGFGDHTVNGGSGSDKVVFGDAAVVVNLLTGQAWRGTEGEDKLSRIENAEMGNGSDTVFGTEGVNTLQGEGGADWMSAFGGNDTIYGGTGGDSLEGGADDDWIDGQWGEDVLLGGAGNDAIGGGSESDVIRGGHGSDTMTGGSGPDTFVWKIGDLGLDRIADFNLASDKFHFGPDFLMQGPISEVLMATTIHGLGTVLMADTVQSNWEMLAVLDGVDAAALNVKIANGTIFDVAVNDDLPGGPGGWDLMV